MEASEVPCLCRAHLPPFPPSLAVGTGGSGAPAAGQGHRQCRSDLAALTSVTVTHSQSKVIPSSSGKQERNASLTLVLLLSCSKSKKILLVIKLQIYHMLK